MTRRHGFVFEVPADGVGDARPIPGLGRFEHEAAAVDPDTGIVYLTEDERRAGLYRFVPAGGAIGSGALRGPGKLQMLAIDGRTDPEDRAGSAVPVTWVDIDDPEVLDGRSVFEQGNARGGKTFKRLEGCWFDGGRLYFVATTGGSAGKGQVWELGVADHRLTLLYESPGRETLDMPDNLVSVPGLGLLLCEDGGSPTRLRLLTESGEIVNVAEKRGSTRRATGLRTATTAAANGAAFAAPAIGSLRTCSCPGSLWRSPDLGKRLPAEPRTFAKAERGA